MTTVAVVPVKRFAGAKTRLTDDLSPGTRRALVRGEMTAGAGIERAFVAMRRAARGRDILAGAEAGIDQPPFAQAREGRCISLTARRLAQHRLFPVEAKPMQILEDRGERALHAASPGGAPAPKSIVIDDSVPRFTGSKPANWKLEPSTTISPDCAPVGM